MSHKCPVCSSPIRSRGMSKKVNPPVELFTCTGEVAHKIQGVLTGGHLTLFQTRKAGQDQKSVYSIRLSAAQVERLSVAYGVTRTGRARVQEWVDDSL